MARQNTISKAKRRHRAVLKENALQSPGTSRIDTTVSTYYDCNKIRETCGFRLLTLLPGVPGEEIQGRLVDHNLKLNPSYVALSYMWGPADSPATIQINRKPLQVRRNLFDALHAFRPLDRELTVWIDAICINQSDIDERNQQVGLMWKIFSAAKAVISWLGVSSAGENVQVDIQHKRLKIDEHQSIDLDVYHNITVKSLSSLEKLYQHLVGNQYWQRAWIRQEVLAASYIIICFGNTKIDWSSFADASVRCRSYRLSLGGSPDHLLSTFTYHGVSKDLWSLIEQRRIGYRGETIRSLIEKYGMSACSDPRDRMFALFGLANNAGDLKSMAGLNNPEYRKQEWRADYSLKKTELYEKLARCGWRRSGMMTLDASFDQHLRRCLDVPESYKLKSPTMRLARRV